MTSFVVTRTPSTLTREATVCSPSSVLADAVTHETSPAMLTLTLTCHVVTAFAGIRVTGTRVLTMEAILTFLTWDLTVNTFVSCRTYTFAIHVMTRATILTLTRVSTV